MVPEPLSPAAKPPPARQTEARDRRFRVSNHLGRTEYSTASVIVVVLVVVGRRSFDSIGMHRLDLVSEVGRSVSHEASRANAAYVDCPGRSGVDVAARVSSTPSSTG